jgi:tetratricopeptide (TPR) repeat protein
MAQKFESLYNQMPEELEKLRPYTGALQAYSLALYNVGRIEEALKYGMMLWKVDPTNVVNANNTAWILATEKKDFAQAMEMIQRAMKLVPNHPQVLDTAGWIAFLGNRYEEAANYLLESIKAGDNAEAHYHLGRLYEARQRPEEARQEYQKAVQMGLKVKDKADAEKRLEQLSASPG